MKSISSPSRLDCLQSALRPNCAAVLVQFLDVAERRMAIGFGLAGPQQIEVRAVEHVNRLGNSHPNPGNVAVDCAVIGNNRAKGKPLTGPAAASNASSNS